MEAQNQDQDLAPGIAQALVGRSDSAWELAKTRFVDDLEPSERQLYDNATVENIYYATSNINRSDADNSRTRTIMKKLEPWFPPLELTVQLSTPSRR